MNTRTKGTLGIVALIPLTLMAHAALTVRDTKGATTAQDKEEFRAVDLVPTKSAGFANSFYTVPPLPY